jgi:hypothetical protein
MGKTYKLRMKTEMFLRTSVPLFTGEDSDPENGFPTFCIHSINACLSLWTGDAKDFMYEINYEMCFAEELNGPVIQPNAIQKVKRGARHKLIVNYQIISRAKSKNPPDLHTKKLRHYAQSGQNADRKM